MDSEITVESLPLIGICNLCLNEEAVKSMFTVFKHNGVQESYSEMLMKCYSIDVTTLQLGDTKRLICEGCIKQLHDASKFKEQAQASLQALETSYAVNSKSSLILPDEEIDGTVKEEPVNDRFDDDFLLDDKDEDADESIMALKIKQELEEQPIKTKRKGLVKRKPRLLKLTIKKFCVSETESMLAAGLFPFKAHHNKKYSCVICTSKTTSLEDMKEHVKEHSKKTIDIAFQNMMFSRSQRFYKFNNGLRCKSCDGDISRFEEIKQHVESCVWVNYKSCKLNSLPFKLEKDQLDCPICKKRFLNFVSLNTHMNEHFPNYICENCGKAFASTARLRGHIRTHEIGEFPCKYCDAVFDRVTKRENHVSKEHKSGVRYVCKRCNISLSSFYARQKHLAEVHNEELKRYKCKSCPQSYITPGHLSSHVRRDHLNERNHKCDKCDLAFYTKNALKMHMIKHDGERIHSCSICQKSYQRKKTLREHMRIHDNDKRFVCPVCTRAFTQKCTLKGHLKTHERKIDIDDSIVHSI